MGNGEWLLIALGFWVCVIISALIGYDVGRRSCGPTSFGAAQYIQSALNTTLTHCPACDRTCIGGEPNGP